MSRSPQISPTRRALPGSLGGLLLRLRQAEATFMVAAALAVGVAAGFCAIGFRYLIAAASWLFTGQWEGTPATVTSLPWWWILLMPALGGLIVGPLIQWLAPETQGSGIPEVIEAVARRGGAVRKRVAALKAFVASITIGAGGSVGREGPIVHIGSAIGSLVAQLLALPARHMRTLVGCGAAGGIAATFNTPIAGAMFAGEVILGDFGVVRFSSIVIASVAATVVSRHYIGDVPAFVVPHFSMINTWEIALHAIIGLAAGLIGVGFIVTLGALRKNASRMPIPAMLRPAVGGLLVGLIGIWLPEVMGVGYHGINGALEARVAVGLLALLLIFKLVATSVTLGSGGSGGIFAPSLFMGAVFGGLCGSVLGQLLPDQVGSPGAYALVAMGAMVAATTRAPITAIIMMFELTGSYRIILPMMAAAILASLLAGRLHPDSIYTAKLRQRGINLDEAVAPNVLKGMKVRDSLTTEMTTVRVDTPLQDVIEHAMQHERPHFPVVNAQGGYVGMISLGDLRHLFYAEEALSDLVVAKDLAHEDIPTVTPDQDLALTMKLLGSSHLDVLPVLEAIEPGAGSDDDPVKHGRLVGLIDRDACIEAYNTEILDRDWAGEALGLLQAVERVRSVDLGSGYALMEVECPKHLVGKTIRETELRPRYNVQIMVVRRALSEAAEDQDAQGDREPAARPRPGQGARLLPFPDLTLRDGDVLVLVGTPEDLGRATA